MENAIRPTAIGKRTGCSDTVPKRDCEPQFSTRSSSAASRLEVDPAIYLRDILGKDSPITSEEKTAQLTPAN